MPGDYKGIDYGLGMANIDPVTGIRYGVISQHSVGQAWYDLAEPDYGEPTCPQCGNEIGSVENTFSEEIRKHEDLPEWAEGKEFACPGCCYGFDSDEAFGDEPLGESFSDKEYTLESCLDSDIMILRSPYYTFAQFCSPCVPGAGNLDNPVEGGVKTYCLAGDWFEGGKAPYPVYRVSDGVQKEKA